MALAATAGSSPREFLPRPPSPHMLTASIVEKKTAKTFAGVWADGPALCKPGEWLRACVLVPRACGRTADDDLTAAVAA